MFHIKLMQSTDVAKKKKKKKIKHYPICGLDMMDTNSFVDCFVDKKYVRK